MLKIVGRVICGMFGFVSKDDLKNVQFKDTCYAIEKGFHEKIRGLKEHLDTRFDDIKDSINRNGFKKN